MQAAPGGLAAAILPLFCFYCDGQCWAHLQATLVCAVSNAVFHLVLVQCNELHSDYDTAELDMSMVCVVQR